MSFAEGSCWKKVGALFYEGRILVFETMRYPSDCQKLNIATSDLDMFGHSLNYTDLHFKHKVFTASCSMIQCNDSFLNPSYTPEHQDVPSFCWNPTIPITITKKGSYKESVFFSHCFFVRTTAVLYRLANDAYEKNCGMIFEYGHTVSHAIEKVGLLTSLEVLKFEWNSFGKPRYSMYVAFVYIWLV